MLALATSVTDTGASLPHTLALTEIESFLGVSNLTNHILQGYSHGVYAWVDGSPRVADAIVGSLYNTGDFAGSVTAQSVIALNHSQQNVIASAGQVAYDATASGVKNTKNVSH